MNPILLLVINTASTIFMTGVIWIVQIVHYPLFAKVGEAGYADYQKSHEFLITFVVGPPMLIELVTSVMLLYLRPPAVSNALVWSGILLVGIAWLSTAFLQVPCHSRLGQSFDSSAHQFLVNSNWIRTIAWTLHMILVCRMLQVSIS